MAGAAPLSDARLAEIDAQAAENDFSQRAARDLYAEVKRLRAREAELAKALPFLRELAQARTSMLDDDDVLIKVSPGRAAWVISRCRTFLLHLREEA